MTYFRQVLHTELQLDPAGKRVLDVGCGGVYLYDTINRTLLSRLVYIGLFQDWGWTSWMPPNLHAWDRFVKPAELEAALRRFQLEPRGRTGLAPAASPPALVGLLRQRKQGKLSYAEFGRLAVHQPTRDTSMLYAGFAVKRA